MTNLINFPNSFERERRREKIESNVTKSFDTKDVEFLEIENFFKKQKSLERKRLIIISLVFLFATASTILLPLFVTIFLSQKIQIFMSNFVFK